MIQDEHNELRNDKDPQVKQILDDLRSGIIERIPQLIEHLDKLPTEEKAKIYKRLAVIFEKLNIPKTNLK